MMTEPLPEYNIVTDCREPTLEECKGAVATLADMVTGRNAELKKLRSRNAILEGRLESCRKERDDYQAVSVRLLGELKTAQDGQKHPAIDFYPEAWRQQE